MTTHHPARRRVARHTLPLGLGLLLALSAPAFAQEHAGAVAGVVVDATSGSFLEGAEIAVVGSDVRTTSSRDGSFTLRGLPAGTYDVTVAYTGLDSQTVKVVVGPDGSATLPPVRLSSGVVVLTEFRIRGTREGMAQATALQKVAIQAKLVAANDQFGEVSEGNIGEYLKFLPGVGIDYNSNDARGIALRGLKTNFTIVAVDGTPMASGASGGDSRRFELEQIAMNNVETTEVYKTVTPDIAADATGGFINMVTKSAFDREDVSLLTYNASINIPSSRVTFGRETNTWGKGGHYVGRPALEANYARRFSEKLGFNINYRLSEIYHDSPRRTLAWQYTGPGISVSDPTLQSFIQNNEQKLTHRESIASKVDYKISDDTMLTLSGQWNWYDLLFAQRAIAYTLVGSNQAPTNLPGADSSVTGTGRTIQNQYLQRAKYGTTLHFNGTLKHDFQNDAKAWLVGYWSKANSKYRDTTKGFLANVNATYTGTIPDFRFDNVVADPKSPDVTFTTAGTTANSVYNLANYTLAPSNSDNFRSRPDTAYDTKTGVNGHYSLPINGLPVPLTIQVGSAFDNAKRDIRRVNIRAATGLASIAGTSLAAYADENLFDYGFDAPLGQTLNSYKFYETYRDSLNLVNNDFVRHFDEDNLAVYARADVKLLPDLLLIGGVRWENRDISANGRNQAIVRNLPATADLSYDNYYPSLTLKYTPRWDKRFVFRGGASRTVGHPDYSELLPDFTGPTLAGANDGSITVPSKDLKPYFVNNYDLVAEFYPSKSGAVSLSLFRKEVKGFIVSQSLAANSTEADAIIKEYNLDPADYAGATKRVNGKNSELMGVEFLYNQTLTFLPKPFDTLNLQFNYTKIDIDADDLDTKYAQELAAVTDAMNIILGWRYGKFNVTVTNNWTGDVLIATPGAQTTTISGTAYTNRITQYKTPERKTSIKVEYAMHKNARIYAEVRNLFYERHEYFQGYYAEDRGVKLPAQQYVYGDPFFVLGVKGTF